MKIFRSYTFTWWQVGVIKLALMAIGLAVGAYWHVFFGANLTVLIVIAVLASLYSMYFSFKQ